MYLKAINGVIEKFPYTIGELRRDNPQTSFPAKPSPELLAEWGVFPVQPVSQPAVDHTKNVSIGQPIDDNGWKQTWVVTDATPGEIEQRTEAQAAEIRAQRDQLLAGSDWTQVADAPVDKAAWAAYRQALREVPEQPGFPVTIDWPVPPQ